MCVCVGPSSFIAKSSSPVQSKAAAVSFQYYLHICLTFLFLFLPVVFFLPENETTKKWPKAKIYQYSVSRRRPGNWEPTKSIDKVRIEGARLKIK